MRYWTVQTSWWQTNDSSHGWYRNAWDGATHLLLRGHPTLGWRLGTHQNHKILTFYPFPITSRGKAYSSCVGSTMFHVVKPGFNLIWPTSPATERPGYGTLDVGCHHLGPSQLARSRGKDVAWRLKEGGTHPSTHGMVMSNLMMGG